MTVSKQKNQFSNAKKSSWYKRIFFSLTKWIFGNEADGCTEGTHASLVLSRNLDLIFLPLGKLLQGQGQLRNRRLVDLKTQYVYYIMRYVWDHAFINAWLIQISTALTFIRLLLYFFTLHQLIWSNHDLSTQPKPHLSTSKSLKITKSLL